MWNRVKTNFNNCSEKKQTWRKPIIIISLDLCPEELGTGEFLIQGCKSEKLTRKLKNIKQNISNPNISTNFSKIVFITQFIYCRGGVVNSTHTELWGNILTWKVEAKNPGTENTSEKTYHPDKKTFDFNSIFEFYLFFHRILILHFVLQCLCNRLYIFFSCYQFKLQNMHCFSKLTSFYHCGYPKIKKNE